MHENKFNWRKNLYLVVIGFFVLFCSGYLAFHLFWTNHRNSQAKILLSQADAIASWYESMFSILSDSTAILKAEFERDPGAWGQASDRLQKYSDTIGRRHSWIPQISIINEQGILVASNLANAPKTDISDRWHFRVHKEGIVDGLYISDVVVGRTSGRAVIQFTRALRSADGVFMGVASFSISVEHLANPGWSESITGEQEFQLVRTDGSIIFSSQHRSIDYISGRKIDKVESDLLRDALVVDHAVYRDSASGWGLIAYRKVPEFRMVIRLHAENILDGVRGRAMLLTALAMFSALATLVAVVTFTRSSRAIN